MSELKAIRSGEIYNIIEYEDCYRTDDLYYPKADADKVIAHHKHKRCLAMAEACMHKRLRHDEGFDYARSTRHMKKWLEIAEQFKHNNSTAQ